MHAAERELRRAEGEYSGAAQMRTSAEVGAVGCEATTVCLPWNCVVGPSLQTTTHCTVMMARENFRKLRRRWELRDYLKTSAEPRCDENETDTKKNDDGNP